jgi:hypothetical protein
MAKSLVSLKDEAVDLGIEFQEDVKASDLQKTIDAFYEAQETSQKELEESMAKIEEKSETAAFDIYLLAAQAEAHARETVVVVINDNDNRVNNLTSLATVNCSNQYFDLGTVRIPLNEAVEIMRGHLNVLREVRIPQHVSDGNSGLSKVVLRPRYSIQEADKKS